MSVQREFDYFNFPKGVTPSEARRCGIIHFECEGKDGSYHGHPNCGLVKLYTKLGLHRYNLLKVKKSELQNTDWISLYVELAICTSHRHIKACHLAKFKWEIVQVAVETLNDVEPPILDSKTAVAYIVYKDLVRAKFDKPCDYKAIVRRHFNETTGMLSIEGKYWKRKTIALSPEKPSKKKSTMLRRRLCVHRIWRLSNPRWYYAYKNHCLGSS